MCRRLHDRGVIVKKIAVVGDEIAEIAEQVKEFSEKFDIVFTTGGIGPTHDDRTFAGLAVAFDDELSTSDELKEVVEVFLRKTKLKNVDEAVEKFCKNKVTQIAQNHAAGGVTIGSYPVMGNSYFKTQLIVESESVEAGEHAYKDLLKSFKQHVVNYDEEPWKDCVEKFRVFRSQQSPEFIDKLDDAMRVIDEIFEQYTLNEIALSFNGGKDCTVLLHLLKIKIEERFGAGVTFNGFHIQNVDEFSELRDFITDVAKKYGLEDRELSGSLKEGLEQLKRHRPDVVAVVMGSRASDPRGRFMKSKCEWTDQDWPRFYRVCPILDWSYADVWRILRGLCIPYCSLYDQGYTSLGDRDKTAPNPALRVPGDEERYRPAYLLEDGGLERLGRRETVPPS
ncbi:putative molybdopterin binding domain containing protein [Aphelenchoides avenae]|nr:putative molybdopterin binding domain containing protein [Aphelenchus avenae]